PSCHVTTNGTVFNSRVARVLETLPVGIAVSLDGVTKETVESIRVNARYEALMRNVERFRDCADRRKTSFSLTFCLMRQNWHELGDFCLFGDDLDCPVFVNSVRRPAEMSLFTLDLIDLARIVEAMEGQQESLLPKLKKNRPVWEGQLRLLKKRASDEVQVPGIAADGIVS
ncbi:MAG TPA: hypothetical protein VEZ90_16375, partial [Blastocatellia bacterium]|nr:hypothetical protein [Blastocatellia bacterium]